jgi:hypothetical protein
VALGGACGLEKITLAELPESFLSQLDELSVKSGKFKITDTEYKEWMLSEDPLCPIISFRLVSS